MGVFDGVGEYSFDGIKLAAMTSGLVGPLPLLFDTSDLRDVPQPFHGTGNAVDWGNDSPNGSPQQDAFAQWVAQKYGPYSLEIIHTYPNGEGIYWKYGQIVNGEGFYGDATVQAHRNHVHWAITNEGLAAVPIPKPEEGLGEMRTIDLNGPLNMQDPIVRTAQGLLEARGGMIKPANTSHDVFRTVTAWFHQQTGLPDQGIFGPLTWQRVVLPLHGK